MARACGTNSQCEKGNLHDDSFAQRTAQHGWRLKALELHSKDTPSLRNTGDCSLWVVLSAHLSVLSLCVLRFFH
jgi:hypothetical protein